MWADDFVFDACANGQQLTCLTVVDEYTRECLSMRWFKNRIDAKFLVEEFRHRYNEVRPHSSLGQLTLFRLPGMLGEEFSGDAQLLLRDLNAAKILLDSAHGSGR